MPARECHECQEPTPDKFQVKVGDDVCCVWCAAHNEDPIGEGRRRSSPCCGIALPEDRSIGCPCKYRDEISEAGNDLDAEEFGGGA